MRTHIFELLKSNPYNHLEVVTFRMNLTNNEILKEINKKNIEAGLQVVELPPLMYDIVEFNKGFSSLKTVTADDITLRTICLLEKITPLLRFIKKTLFYIQFLDLPKWNITQVLCA